MNDFINGCLEMVGALLLLNNCRLLLRHKRLQGVSVTPTAFFTVWGGWNLYFYPANGLWLSFLGGLCLACVNLAWVALAFHYCRRAHGTSREIAQEEFSYFKLPRPASPDFVANAATRR